MPTRSPRTTAKQSLYEDITAKIIAELEAGIFPWARPWSASGASEPFALPRNAATGKSYSGRRGRGSWANTIASWPLARNGRWSSGRDLSCRMAIRS
nr:ArdC family protein [Bradyrhizobium ivorense]